MIRTFSLLLFLALFQYSYANDFPQDTVKKEMVYDMPEHMPQFPGGADAMEQFIKINIKYPTSAKERKIQGKVYVGFVVEKDGTITGIRVRKGAHELLDKEAVRVIKSMPNWKPGSVRGKIVRVRHTIPIIFALS